METQEEVLTENQIAKRVLRTLELIAWTNQEIEGGTRENDRLRVYQYRHLKSKFVRELMELLAEYQIPVQLQEGTSLKLKLPA